MNVQLSPAERVRIAQIIWESVEQIPDSDKLSDEQMTELTRRLTSFKENGSQGRPWGQVLKDINSDI